MCDDLGVVEGRPRDIHILDSVRSGREEAKTEASIEIVRIADAAKPSQRNRSRSRQTPEAGEIERQQSVHSRNQIDGRAHCARLLEVDLLRGKPFMLRADDIENFGHAAVARNRAVAIGETGSLTRRGKRAFAHEQRVVA